MSRKSGLIFRRAGYLALPVERVDARGAKTRVFDLPAGASRLVRDGNGLLGVWVNGIRVVNEQELIAGDHRPGHVLREFTC